MPSCQCGHRLEDRHEERGEQERARARGKEGTPSSEQGEHEQGDGRASSHGVVLARRAASAALVHLCTSACLESGLLVLPSIACCLLVLVLVLLTPDRGPPSQANVACAVPRLALALGKQCELLGLARANRGAGSRPSPTHARHSLTLQQRAILCSAVLHHLLHQPRTPAICSCLHVPAVPLSSRRSRRLALIAAIRRTAARRPRLLLL